MTEADAKQVFSQFSKLITRFAETSEPSSFRKIEKDELNVMLVVKGNFGVATDLFEAIRVLGGHKLPKKAI